ncbi:hypothetical protein [Candidatus Liberibacter africanus]|uniref:Uncharacterized protein n=1 Tax=Candidatus Liberibacter africanus PTSAPSY TaxID=1277257 RepID=A0A0G3I2F6_LIBAF|nr:hypothetical protein [Candidatus Liberibacter africanus]AKK20054.1 hypothetical protein G293_02110 [Candidatus Liberibacter africanus PTSAPSY]
MTKKQEQYVRREEFNALNTKVDCLIKHCRAFESHYNEQQAVIKDILHILNTSRGVVLLIKTTGAITASLSAITYALYNLKGWLKQ